MEEHIRGLLRGHETSLSRDSSELDDTMVGDGKEGEATNPTTLKSFALKFVETVNAIIETRQQIEERKRHGPEEGRSFSFPVVFFCFPQPWSRASPLGRASERWELAPDGTDRKQNEE